MQVAEFDLCDCLGIPLYIALFLFVSENNEDKAPAAGREINLIILCSFVNYRKDYLLML